MGLVFIPGQMEEGTKESIKKIKNMDMEFIIGQMEEFTMDGGLKVNKTD